MSLSSLAQSASLNPAVLARSDSMPQDVDPVHRADLVLERHERHDVARRGEGLGRVEPPLERGEILGVGLIQIERM